MASAGEPPAEAGGGRGGPVQPRPPLSRARPPRTRRAVGRLRSRRRASRAPHPPPSAAEPSRAEPSQAGPARLPPQDPRRVGPRRGPARPALMPPPAPAGAVARGAMATHMTDAHRQFLQALMALGIVESAEAAALHRQCCELHKVYYATDKLDDFVNVANLQLQPLFLEIRKGVAEDTGRTCYALVNLAETEVTKMANDCSETELELFKKIMDLIILSENGFASSTEILNSADQLKPKKMKKEEAEQVLRRLVQSKWLSEREGEYTLHTRCILELENYILGHYPDTARKCHICHSLLIQGQVCTACGIAMHLPCLAKYFRPQTEARCPHCKQFWPHQIPGTAIGSPAAPLSSSTPKENRKIPPVRPRWR
ncbi:non-structural maintenance of chromosomes element 1 homolog [Eublepharis macularius]|uniref:Non-structural maintenance of chromosomes element 1 homolog n=1 Tax=Eublepharis macularius TaxID=481883 RepID=A0AA97K4F0_EUBMA|nr:non-structural maintenance of chromosomes element 1 homolog [Eublepharis macularius]